LIHSSLPSGSKYCRQAPKKFPNSSEQTEQKKNLRILGDGGEFAKKVFYKKDCLVEVYNPMLRAKKV
jgi:hypothetical protein